LKPFGNQLNSPFIMNPSRFAGSTGNKLRFNADSGTNYSNRVSTDGGADATTTSDTEITDTFGGATGIDPFYSYYISNLSSKEKLVNEHFVSSWTAGAGNAPRRQERVGKWTNTSNAIDQITANNTGAGDYPIGSEVVVLGWDPADTHTTNFWEELASVDLSGGAVIL
jgi:hypothetical protein